MKFSEAVSPMHPDRIADRIAGGIVDFAYENQKFPKVAVEVLIGHGKCFVIVESSLSDDVLTQEKVSEIVGNICEVGEVVLVNVPQDSHLSKNQDEVVRCGDQGVFSGYVLPDIHLEAKTLVKELFDTHPYDGKLVVDEQGNGVVSWSNISTADLKEKTKALGYSLSCNPLGDWIGGIDSDTGVTGRKLAVDFYGIDYPLGGGSMWNKDLSKSDVSTNIWCFLEAQRTGMSNRAYCAIGDTYIKVFYEDGTFSIVAFKQMVDEAQEYVKACGGYSNLAKYGLMPVTFYEGV